MDRAVKLAVVIPILNEQDILPELFRRLTESCDRVPDAQWRVVLVNDGSADDSARMIREKHASDPRFTLVNLSRNFGHQPAISAGLAQAGDADAVVVMDGDLQDPPEVIPALVGEWRAGGQVVRALRRSRPERGLRRIGFALFHKLFHWLSDYPIPEQTGVFGLLDREAVAQLNAMPERNRFIPGLRSWIGFEQRELYYERHERAAGKPRQGLGRLFRYAFDAIFSFSYKPLRMLMALGVLITTTGFVMTAFYWTRRLIGIETAPTGFTTLVTLVLFLGGVQLVAIGVLGEYLARIYDEVKQRPLYIVQSEGAPRGEPEER
jgi:dolichol-phosphate mannosyltransferase